MDSDGHGHGRREEEEEGGAVPAITLTDASPVQSPVFGGIGGRIGGKPETPSSGGQNGRS